MTELLDRLRAADPADGLGRLLPDAQLDQWRDAGLSEVLSLVSPLADVRADAAAPDDPGFVATDRRRRAHLPGRRWWVPTAGVAAAAALAISLGLPGRTPYASSKAGVLGLTRVWALEWAGKGVTCNAICPGPFATDMNKQLLNDPQAYQQFVANIPMGRWGELEELTGAIVFLASEASSFVTGTSLFIDGGWTAR